MGNRARTWAVMAAPLLMMAIAVVAAMLHDIDAPKGPSLTLPDEVVLHMADLSSKATDLPPLSGDPFHLKDAVAAAGKAFSHRGMRDDFKVGLIVISSKGSLAEINGRFLAPGDVISGAQIRKIEKNRVLIAGRRTFWRYLEKR